MSLISIIERMTGKDVAETRSMFGIVYYMRFHK